MTDPLAPAPTPPEQGGTSPTLLLRMRGNEPEAWRVMVQLYTPLVYAWCGRAGVHGADADDVAQEVFRSAAAHLDQFRRDRAGDSFRGWLRTIARNAVRMHFRSRGRQPRATGGTSALRHLNDVADPADGFEDDGAEVGALTRQAVELIRGEFEEPTFRMFWQTAVEGRTPDAVSAEAGVSAAAVRKAKSRVLRRLKDHFAELLG